MLPLRGALVNDSARPRTGNDRLCWERDGGDWPNRDASRFVVAGDLSWHVQQLGQGPVVLLLHGTGASTHSWRDFGPLLARHFTVIAPDLPGHAFTDPLPAGHATLGAMSRALGTLVEVLGVAPEMVIGHSAGAAIAARMSLDRLHDARAIISLNGALLPLPGVPGIVFAPLARMLAATPFAARLFAWRARDQGAVARLVASTGSTLDETGVALYARLVQSPGHVASVLDMMASWDLATMQRDLPRLVPLLALVVGDRDHTVPMSEAERVRGLLPSARSIVLPGLGHLAHEEAPAVVARVVLDVARTAGIAPAG